MAHWDQQHLCSTGTQVRSLAQHSGLEIQLCSSCCRGHTCGLDLIPDLGTPHAAGQQQKEKKKAVWCMLTTPSTFTPPPQPWLPCARAQGLGKSATHKHICPPPPPPVIVNIVLSEPDTPTHLYLFTATTTEMSSCDKGTTWSAKPEIPSGPLQREFSRQPCRILSKHFLLLLQVSA